MKSMLRIFAYLRYFPVQITFNVIFNLLHILCSVGAYVMIIPFVELLFPMNGAPAAEPSFGLSQQQLVDWGMWHLHHYHSHH